MQKSELELIEGRPYTLFRNDFLNHAEELGKLILRQLVVELLIKTID